MCLKRKDAARLLPAIPLFGMQPQEAVEPPPVHCFGSTLMIDMVGKNLRPNARVSNLVLKQFEVRHVDETEAVPDKVDMVNVNQFL